MLYTGESLQCGVYDSSILRRGDGRSPDRRVVYYEVELFHGTGGVSHVNKGVYPVRRGMLLCAKPGQVRYSEFPVRCSFIRLEKGVFPELDGLLEAAPDCFYVEDMNETEELLALFSRLAGLWIGTGREQNQLRIHAVLLELLSRLQKLWQGEGQSASGAPVSPLVRDAHEYIREHYFEKCTLETVAAALHISPHYLHTVFRREMGETLLEALTRRRVEKAKQRLMSGEESLLEIALATGFCSQSHFSKVFREQTGITPAAYRRGLLERY